MGLSKRQKRLLTNRLINSVRNLSMNPYKSTDKKEGQVFYLSKTKIGSYVRHKKVKN